MWIKYRCNNEDCFVALTSISYIRVIKHKEYTTFRCCDKYIGDSFYDIAISSAHNSETILNYLLTCSSPIFDLTIYQEEE